MYAYYHNDDIYVTLESKIAQNDSTESIAEKGRELNQEILKAID